MGNRTSVGFGALLVIDTAHFWRSNYYKHPPLTDALVSMAEATLGVRLPAEFIGLLRVQNGGYTHGFRHVLPTEARRTSDEVRVEALFGILPDPDFSKPQNILLTPRMAAMCGLPPQQVVLCGNGHEFVTLDYRNGRDPCVSWIDNELGEKAVVAASFAAFLDGLSPLERPRRSGK